MAVESQVSMQSCEKLSKASSLRIKSVGNTQVLLMKCIRLKSFSNLSVALRCVYTKPRRKEIGNDSKEVAI